MLVGLASSPRAIGKIVSHIKSAGATVTLIQFLEAPHPDLRVTSVKLLFLLSTHMGQELADGLRVTTHQLSTLLRLLRSDGEMGEQAAAAGLLANLPMDDLNLTHALLDEGALPVIINRIQDLRRGISCIGSGRHMAPLQSGLVGILSRFTYALDDKDIQALAMEYNFTPFFTSLLQSAGLDDVERCAAVALENLSRKSKDLSEFPDLPQSKGAFMDWLGCVKRPSLPSGLCPVHGGICSAKETFCLLEANAVSPLVACLDHKNPSIVEAALGTLSTLMMDTIDVERSSQVCTFPWLVCSPFLPSNIRGSFCSLDVKAGFSEHS